MGLLGWTEPAVRVSGYFGVSCADLWPEHVPPVDEWPWEAQEPIATPEDLYLRAELIAAALAALETIPERHAEAVRLYLGLRRSALPGGEGGEGDEGVMYREVGAALGVSGTRARELCIGGLVRLRNALKRHV